jgi:hypothetical protein
MSTLFIHKLSYFPKKLLNKYFLNYLKIACLDGLYELDLLSNLSAKIIIKKLTQIIKIKIIAYFIKLILNISVLYHLI